MSALVNPLEDASSYDTTQKQTVEIRCPDGSANIYLLMASLAVAARYGFEMPNALEVAKNTYVDVNIHKAENADKLAKLAQLPVSCTESAECLEKQRAVYEKYNVFSPAMIDGIIKKLKDYDDSYLRAEVELNPEAMLNMVRKYFHCG
jgi:glutamine synthetase